MKRYLFVWLVISLGFCVTTLALKVGVTAGPHADITQKVAELARKQGLAIDIIEFNDFILPNEALANKDIDVNSFQHGPYLKGQMETRGYKFKVIGQTVIMPLGAYSTKIKSLNDLPPNGKVIIPNDPTNGGRALKLLAKNHVIEMNEGENPSILDIRTNPKNISFLEIEAPLVPRSLRDADAGITNTDWILQAGLDPQSAIATEGKDSPYANVVVVRAGDEAREDIQKFMALYHSPEVRSFVEETYKGAVIPAW